MISSHGLISKHSFGSADGNAVSCCLDNITSTNQALRQSFLNHTYLHEVSMKQHTNLNASPLGSSVLIATHNSTFPLPLTLLL